jgi:hypothetical protein
MAFTSETWKAAFTERLSHWRQRMQQGGVTSVYAFVSAMALWPIAATLHGGDVGAAVALIEFSNFGLMLTTVSRASVTSRRPVLCVWPKNLSPLLLPR